MTALGLEPDVSVVLPVYNERGHLREEILRIRKALEGSDYSFEVIVVDDGSTDGSLKEIQDLEEIRVIRFGRNRGTGSARKAGTAAARGRVVVWTDADMSYPNEQIPDLVRELDGNDQVVGARTSEEGTARLPRRAAKWFVARLASYLVRTPIPDLNSGLRCFRRDVALQFLHLLPTGFSCVSTITLTFIANGYGVRHVPISYASRAGRSKFHWWSDTREYLTQVVRIVLSYNPLRVFLPVGLVLLVAGTGKLAYDWISKDFHLATNTLLLFFASFQAFAIGFLADLVVRVNAPRTLVEPAEPRP